MKMYKLLFFIMFLSISSHRCVAQSGDPDLSDSIAAPVMEEQPDTSPTAFAKEVLGDTLIILRELNISTDSINVKKNKKSYAWISSMDSLLHAYEEEAKKRSAKKEIASGSSALDRFFGSAFLQIFLWIVAGGVVGYIIYQLFLNKGAFRTSTKWRKTAEIPETDDNDIAGKDYETLSRRAAASGDYRRATRFLFLMTLQKLQDDQLIVYAVDKTNSTYLKELPLEKRNDFARLALYYEYIWYGNAHMEKEIYRTVETTFTAFLNRI